MITRYRGMLYIGVCFTKYILVRHIINRYLVFLFNLKRAKKYKTFWLLIVKITYCFHIVIRNWYNSREARKRDFRSISSLHNISTWKRLTPAVYFTNTLTLHTHTHVYYARVTCSVYSITSISIDVITRWTKMLEKSKVKIVHITNTDFKIVYRWYILYQ